MIYIYRTQHNGQTEFFSNKRDAVRAAKRELRRTNTGKTYVYASAFASRKPDEPEMHQFKRRIVVCHAPPRGPVE